MSTFDAAAFEQMTIEQANETKSTPVPEGDFEANIDSVRIKSIAISKGDRAGQEVPILEITWHIRDDDGKLKKELNRDKVTVRQDLWLDVTESGALAFGPNNNVALGRVRQAVGLNKPGKPFTFKMLEGQGPAMIHVSQEHRDDLTYNRVTRVQEVA